MHFNQITYSTWCFILYHYTTAKYILRSIIKNEHLLFVFALLPTIFLCLNTCLIVIIFGTYRGFVYICLKICYGKKFIKFIPGPAVITSYNAKDFNHISILTKVTTHLSGNELFEEINDRIFEKFFITDIRNEIFCLLRRRMGYCFIVSLSDLEIEEVVREIKTDKEVLTHAELQDYMKKYFGSPMPRNNELTIDMAMCTTPLEDPENVVGKKTYACFLRIKHAIGDGLVIYNLLTNAFTRPSEENEAYVKKLTQSNNKFDKFKKCHSHVVNVHQGISFNRQLIWSKNTLTNGLFVSAERDCIWKIREVRKCFPGVSFLNVIITAYTASMADYFQKHFPNDIPESINVGAPFQVNLGRVQRMLTEGEKNDFDNDFSGFQLICPLRLEKDTKESIIQRLLLVQAEFEKVLNSFDIIASYITYKVHLKYLPIPFVKILCKKIFYTTLISCVPGGPKRTLFNGAEAKFPMFFLPMQHAIGIGVSILTYDDKMQAGFTLDSSKFDSQEKIDMVINGIFDYIDLIYEEGMKRLNYNSISRL